LTQALPIAQTLSNRIVLAVYLGQVPWQVRPQGGEGDLSVGDEFAHFDTEHISCDHSCKIFLKPSRERYKQVRISSDAGERA
jgi:hypothetical protein